MKKQKILIVRMDRLGDLLLSTPAIRAVRKAMPQAHIAIMVRPYTYDIIKHNPDIDEIIVYDREGKHKGALGNVKFVFRLFMKRFDSAIILHSSNRSVMLPFFAGIKRRIGYDRRAKHFLTHAIKSDKHLGKKHEIDYTLDVVREFGVDTAGADRRPVMEIGADDAAKVDALLKRKGVKEGDRLVLINPGASCPSRIWRKDRYREVINHLLHSGGCRVVLIGGEDGVDLAGEVLNGIEMRVLNFTGLLTVAELGALMKRSSLLISNDTGPVHIASAVGTPVIAIFGRKDPGLSPVVWGPIGESNIVLHKDSGCVTCLAHNCKNRFKCLDVVTVSDVIGAAEKILGRIM